MERYHVTDIMIDRPHVKKTIYLPVYIRHVTGVLFFPVIPPQSDGIPDGEPLGIAGLSLQNERLNVVTNLKIYRKSPIFYEAPDYKTAGGDVYLDRGYGAYDFFPCNDQITPNSFAIFKYTNRKMVKSVTNLDLVNDDMERLKSLIYSPLNNVVVTYRNRTYRVSWVSEWDNMIYVFPVGNGIYDFPSPDAITKSALSSEIYKFINADTGLPFFESDGSDRNWDAAFVIKLILRYQSEHLINS